MHYKYNFKFETQDINRDINITKPMSTYVIHSYPETLDFTLTDSLTIIYTLHGQNI